MVGVTRPTSDQIVHNGQSLQEFLNSLRGVITGPEMETMISELETRLSEEIKVSSEDESIINAIIFG